MFNIFIIFFACREPKSSKNVTEDFLKIFTSERKILRNKNMNLFEVELNPHSDVTVFKLFSMTEAAAAIQIHQQGFHLCCATAATVELNPPQAHGPEFQAL